MGFSLDEKASAQVLRQVEFYFSDSNLPGDKFLRQCMEESQDGLVSLPLVCSFGRMRSHLNLKASGPNNVPPEVAAAVAEVLRKSTVLIVSDDGQKVGRVAPLMKLEEVQAAVDARSIAVGPLRWSVTMEEVETFFSQHAKVNSVRLPRHAGGKAFCGYALLELISEDEAKRMLESKVSYDGIEELEIKSKKDFDAEMKTRQQASRNSQPGEQQLENSNGRRFESYPRGLIVSFSLQKVGPNDADETENKEAPPVEGEAAGASSAREEGPGNEENQIMREDIRNAFKAFGCIKFVDHSRGAMTGYLRFERPEEVHKARTAAVLSDAGGIMVKDYIATLEAVEGDAEAEYWAKLRSAQDKVRGNSSRDGRGSRGRGGGQRGRSARRGGRGNQQQDREKEADNVKLGKHERFVEDPESGDEAERPAKQSKTGEEEADVVVAKQSDTAEDLSM